MVVQVAVLYSKWGFTDDSAKPLPLLCPELSIRYILQSSVSGRSCQGSVVRVQSKSFRARCLKTSQIHQLQGSRDNCYQLGICIWYFSLQDTAFSVTGLRVQRHCQIPFPQHLPQGNRCFASAQSALLKKHLLHLMLTKCRANFGKYCPFSMHTLKKIKIWKFGLLFWFKFKPFSIISSHFDF